MTLNVKLRGVMPYKIVLYGRPLNHVLRCPNRVGGGVFPHLCEPWANKDGCGCGGATRLLLIRAAVLQIAILSGLRF